MCQGSSQQWCFCERWELAYEKNIKHRILIRRRLYRVLSHCTWCFIDHLTGQWVYKLLMSFWRIFKRVLNEMEKEAGVKHSQPQILFKPQLSAQFCRRSLSHAVPKSNDQIPFQLVKFHSPWRKICPVPFCNPFTTLFEVLILHSTHSRHLQRDLQTLYTNL